MDNRPIGVFDSGVGGISVLGELIALLPYEKFIFLGDTSHVPFGSRNVQEIIRFTREGIFSLIDNYQCKAIVIACNTATSAAADGLRNELDMPIVGMEPALKPASMVEGDGYVAVLATEATLRLPKFSKLMERFGEKAIPVPCPGLVEYVEANELHSDSLKSLLAHLLEPVQRIPVKAVVLGCTHYPFIREEIAAFFKPGTPLIDGGVGTARQLERKLVQNNLLSDFQTKQKPVLLSTAPGHEINMLHMLHWWQENQCREYETEHEDSE